MSDSASAGLIEGALARAGDYELFAHCFAYPDGERVAALREVAGEVLNTNGWLPAMRLAAVAREIDRANLEPVYVSLVTFSGSPDCPAYETAYFSSDAQQQTLRMADVAGFYRAFGVDATSGGFRPDELPVELEFMAYLCRKEAHAVEHKGAPRVAQVRRAQRVFLEDHLGRWASVFGERIADGAPAGHFYALAGRTLQAWLGVECRWTGATPALVAGPATPAVVPASHGPEYAGPAAIVPVEEIAVR
jgi:TorA maturation chaperone TorD